jgi:hypothetical protein
MIGAGMHAAWLRTWLQLALTGAIAGLIYEHRQHLRGEGDRVALLLPIASGVSGLLALVTAV